MPPSFRLESTFASLRASGRKAFVAYITAGDPSPNATPELVWALERAGADVVELGMPFSDPLADGVVNQLSAQRALNAGTTPPGVLDIVRKVREKSQVPLVLYTYFNLLDAYGLEKFGADAAAAGVDGILILDLPPEERAGASAVDQILAAGALARICLIAPTTPTERMDQILPHAGGFVYYVSREGVTGMQTSVASGVEERVAQIRSKTDLPICVGFGISTPDQAYAVSRWADGAVIGSLLVNRIAEWAHEPDAASRLEVFARPLAEAIHR